MSVCVFDNPATMRRECWQSGRLIADYSFHLFFIEPFPVPAERFFFGANVGPWSAGRLTGDAAARLEKLT